MLKKTRIYKFTKRWWFYRTTGQHLSNLLFWGWCPMCNSSPPAVRCEVCRGSADYGKNITLTDKQYWASRYIVLREMRWMTENEEKA